MRLSRESFAWEMTVAKAEIYFFCKKKLETVVLLNSLFEPPLVLLDLLAGELCELCVNVLVHLNVLVLNLKGRKTMHYTHDIFPVKFFFCNTNSIFRP